MDPCAFDQLVRGFSHSASRRQVLGGLLAGALAARLSLLRGAGDGALARGKWGARRARDAQGQQKYPVCHNGMTRWLPRPAVQAHLAHGDLAGPCLAEGTCAPLGQPCDRNQPNQCCDDFVTCLPAQSFAGVCTKPCAGLLPTPDEACQLALERPGVYCAHEHFRCGLLPGGSCCLPCTPRGQNCEVSHCCPGLACRDGQCQPSPTP